jgi:tRNA G18 (ribose-2'-O)-methylase SpoU
MIQAQTITSFDQPELMPYRTMRRQHEHREQGLFVAEGEKVVRRLLESRFTVVSILMPPKWLPELTPLIESRPEPVRVFLAEKTLLETLTGFSMYQGLLGVGIVPPQPSLDELLTQTSSPRLLVAAEGLSSADNMGSMVRNCAAFAAHGLLVGETSSSPFLRRAVRSSMGAIFHLPIVESTNLVQSLRDLRARGIRVVGAHPHAELKTLPEADFKKDCCILLGSEGNGITPEALAECDETVAIPMPPDVDSLNVAAAAGVFLYEASRQRGQMSRRVESNTVKSNGY